ncbi:sporulation factor SpoIVFB. Metallo peptidase. MEROPS family M50B [Bacillus sp. cl95]|nr:sporulation factor SpoIVFB. Metallo peptidase. MEROPS family M50B [Bacillus sp. cl95]
MSLLQHIRIHPLLWIVMGVAVLTAHFMELCLLLIIVFVHEMGHAAAASFYSWRIKSISLLPFGGVVEMDEHGNRPLKQEAVVILAGPFQHVWMVAVATILFQFAMIPEHLFYLFLQYNGMILFFNLLPIWPLDGGKFVFLLFSRIKPFPDAHRLSLYVSMISLFFMVILTLLGGPTNLNSWIIICFLAFSLYHEWKQRRYVFMRFLIERYYGKKGDLQQLKPLIVAETDLLANVLEKFHRGCKHPIVVEKAGHEKRVLDENEVLHAFFAEKRVSDKIADLLYSY